MVTVKELAADFHRHVERCEKASLEAAASMKSLQEEVVALKEWLNGVLSWWRRFRRWVWSAAGAIILTVLAGSVGSFWSSIQTAQAAQQAASLSPTLQAKRDAREQAILIELSQIKKQIGAP